MLIEGLCFSQRVTLPVKAALREIAIDCRRQPINAGWPSAANPEQKRKRHSTAIQRENRRAAAGKCRTNRILVVQSKQF